MSSKDQTTAPPPEPRPLMWVSTPENTLPSDPPRPLPDPLTIDEAIIFLRLDKCAGDPKRALRRYTNEFSIRTVRMGTNIMYPVGELRHFLETKFAKENANAKWPPATRTQPAA